MKIGIDENRIRETAAMVMEKMDIADDDLIDPGLIMQCSIFLVGSSIKMGSDDLVIKYEGIEDTETGENLGDYEVIVRKIGEDAGADNE